MSYERVLIDTMLHEKMKDIARKKDSKIIDIYREALRGYTTKTTQEIMLTDSNLEGIFNQRIGKAEDHLASMLARTGMDVSMILMAFVYFFEQTTEMSRKEITEMFRKDGSEYFLNVIKKDREYKQKRKMEEQGREVEFKKEQQED